MTYQLMMIPFDLNDYEGISSNAYALEKREDVKVCGSMFELLSTTCYNWSTFGVFLVSLVFKRQKGLQLRRIHNQQLRLCHRRHRDCDTTAQRTTIEGALESIYGKTTRIHSATSSATTLPTGGRGMGTVYSARVITISITIRRSANCLLKAEPASVVEMEMRRNAATPYM